MFHREVAPEIDYVIINLVYVDGTITKEMVKTDGKTVLIEIGEYNEQD